MFHKITAKFSVTAVKWFVCLEVLAIISLCILIKPLTFLSEGHREPIKPIFSLPNLLPCNPIQGWTTECPGDENTPLQINKHIFPLWGNDRAARCLYLEIRSTMKCPVEVFHSSWTFFTFYISKTKILMCFFGVFNDSDQHKVVLRFEVERNWCLVFK